MEKFSLYRDLVRNPRESDDSRIVAAKWGATVDAYLPEIPDASSLQYFNLSAERLLFRSKILSLTIDQELAESESLQTARPFGKGGPTFAMLRDLSVRMAMAFVPLTPTGGNGKAILARLYCVTGLSDKNKPPFEKGVDSPDIDKYSWFVAGVPAVFEGEMLSGRSWLLAAHLLMQVVNAKDNATARNLATNFIITGDVESGSIKEVDMGQKPNLANIKEYRAYKWIIPMKNANEMTNVPSRKIEKPATLEEAYKLIETMQNEATRALHRFLRSYDLDGMKGQKEKMGADIFSEDKESGKMPLQIISEKIRNTQKAIAQSADDAEKNRTKEILNKQCAIKRWLKAEGADCAMFFYLLAKLGMKEALSEGANSFPINAKDESGLNAMDWALIAEDWESARLLHSFGGMCKVLDATTCSNSKLRNAIEHFGKESDDQFRLLETAMEVGLSPNVTMRKAIWYPDEESNWTEGSLFGMALCMGDSRLVALCLKYGADPNVKLRFGVPTRMEMPHSDWIELKEVEEFRSFSCALELLYRRGEMTHCTCSKEDVEQIKTMLIKYGAMETPETIVAVEKLEKDAVLNDGAARHSVFLASLRKLCSKDDSEQNHKLIIECLNRGESMEEEVFGEIYGERGAEPFCIRSSLWGMAIMQGWTDIVEACIRHGANLNDQVYFEGGWFTDIHDAGEDYHPWKKMIPIEFVKESHYKDGATKSRLLELLSRRFT